MRSKVLLIASITSLSLIATLSAAPALATGSHDNSDHKVNICHATGSKTNPYVFITVDEHAVKAHQNHHDGRDMVGVKSAKDCSKPSPTSTPKPSTSPTPGSVLGSSTQAQSATLPETGAEAGLSALIGLPTLAVAGRAYLRSRR